MTMYHGSSSQNHIVRNISALQHNYVATTPYLVTKMHRRILVDSHTRIIHNTMLIRIHNKRMPCKSVIGTELNVFETNNRKVRRIAKVIMKNKLTCISDHDSRTGTDFTFPIKFNPSTKINHCSIFPEIR